MPASVEHPGAVWITDYVTNPDIERSTLGTMLSDQPHDGVEVLIVWHAHIGPQYIARFPRLKGVVRYGVGYDNLELDVLRSRGIVACNTPDYGIDEVADTAVAMILNIARGMTRYNEQARHHVTTWQENVIPEIKRTNRCRVGVVGAGRIGSSVLLKTAAIGFQTMFYDPFKPSGYEKTLRSDRAEDLQALLTVADIISVHVPLSSETRGMINGEFVANMKRGSSIVNTARGGLLANNDVLFDALQSGQLASVALDVLPDEPPRSSLLIDAWRRGDARFAGRVIINPHTAYYSQTAYREMREKAALNARRIIEGRQPLNVLN